MNRRLAAVAAGLILAMAGCGIPDETGVRDQGPARAPAAAQGDAGAGIDPPTRRAKNDNTREFVSNFLKAAAGEPEDAVKRVREFVTEANQDLVKEPNPEAGLTIVRLREADMTVTVDSGIERVTIPVQQVGILKSNGAVEPPTATETEYKLTVTGGGGEQTNRYIDKPPPVLLLSEDALEDFYQQRTLYFWDTDRQVLVPDLRYLPGKLSAAQRPTELLDRLLGGPSLWLAPAVQKLPNGTEREGNVIDTPGVLKVSLNAKAAAPADTEQLREQQLKMLATQLLWSLRPELDRNLELTIKGQNPRIFERADLLRPTSTQNLPSSPERFGIHQGRIYRVKPTPGRPNSALPPEGINRNVLSAGLTLGDGVTLAALVVTEGAGGEDSVGGQRRLSVGRGNSFHTSRVGFTSIGRPVWLPAPSDAGLVVADGGLYLFRVGTRDLIPVAVPGIPGSLTSVGVAPDGRRIAVVANGVLYVATLDRTGDAIAVGSARLLPTSLQTLTAVDFSAENLLVVAGRGADKRTAFYDLSIDGAIETPLVKRVDLGEANVIHLDAYPNALRLKMYATSATAYDENGQEDELRAGELEVASVTPAPTGSATPGPGENPSAPFFLS